jgi:prepilin-type N-terminal cleavage/methylation domain-containing protein
VTWLRVAHLKGQSGYTLIELIITAAIGALLLGALVSVFLTTTRATDTATGRVEASGQVRNFEIFAYEDFTGAGLSDFSPGCTASSPCQTQITLTEIPIDNPGQTYTVSYAWDKTNLFLDRTVGNNPPLHAATNVAAFSWYLDTNRTVVVTLTIVVNSYTQSQTFRFYPRRSP